MCKNLRLVVFAILLLSACSSRQLAQGTFGAEKARISDVKVVFDPQAISQERVNAINNLHLDDMLKSKVEKSLSEIYKAYGQDGRYSMVISIEDLRIRHGASKAFFGMFAGKDSLNVKVLVKDGDRPVGMFSTLSRGQGGAFSISMDSRAENLTQDISHKIAHLFARATPGTMTVEGTNQVVALDQTAASSIKETVAMNSSRPSISNTSVDKSPVTKSSNSTKCSVEQVLSMQNSGFTAEQIKAACN